MFMPLDIDALPEPLVGAGPARSACPVCLSARSIHSSAVSTADMAGSYLNRRAVLRPRFTLPAAVAAVHLSAVLTAEEAHMRAGHCTITHDPELQGVGAGFSAEASAVLYPPAQTGSVREGGEEISLEQALRAPVSEPGEEGYPEELDEDDDTEECPILSREPYQYNRAHPLHAEFVMVAIAHGEAADEHLNAVVFGDADAEELGRRADGLFARMTELRRLMQEAA